VVRRISQAIRRNYAGFHSGRPIGSFLFLGPTGVGKTELVKVLADFLFRDRDAIVRLDMSEYTESHAISRMVGAPPGYVGFESGGQLTEAVRRKPYQIILFDEIEKAHPEVLNILLQLLDDGRLTDGQGRTVDFSNTVIVMTSNLGSSHFSAGLKDVARGRIGFGSAAGAASGGPSLTPEVRRQVIEVARTALTPELWNRIEERLVFGPLSRSEIGEIANLQLRDSSRRLGAEREIWLQAEPKVLEFLIDRGGYDPQLGARPMRQTIQRLVEGPVADMILRGEVSTGETITVRVADGELEFVVEAEGV
jgi:ATP-dependent Clp protease ATP-binding subunit ClpC